MAKNERNRIFATVIYPESAPKNFKDIISDWHIEAFLSPLHDKDINANGEPKKPHYHLLVKFQGLKSDDQVKSMFAEVNGVGLEKVKSYIGMARYLCHLDNPEKSQYNKSNVLCFGGLDYFETIERSADVLQIIKDMSLFVLENDIFTLSQLFRYAYTEGKDDWIRILTMKSTLWFTALVKSNQYEKKQMILDNPDCKTGKKLIVDYDTGEVTEIN